MRILHIYWKGWIWITIITVLLLLLLNFVLPLESFFPVIGNANDWMDRWIVIIFSIIGSIMQLNFSRMNHVKEQKLVTLRTKLENSNASYRELNDIVEGNISILNFNEFSKLIHHINHQTTNTELIAKLYDYESSVLSAQKKIDLFFLNKEKHAEFIVYRESLVGFVRMYKKIFPEFIKYLNSVDKNIHKSMANIDIQLPIAEEKDKPILSMLKMTGNNMIYEYKDKFINILNDQKDNMDKLAGFLNCASEGLLKIEYKKIKKIESEIENESK